jgi:predicted nucleic acid-binding protein
MIALDTNVVSELMRAAPDPAVDYAMIAGLQALRGRRIAMADAMIAATCMASGATLATRNVKDFTGLGIGVVDPWRPDA